MREVEVVRRRDGARKQREPGAGAALGLASATHAYQSSDPTIFGQGMKITSSSFNIFWQHLHCISFPAVQSPESAFIASRDLSQRSDNALVGTSAWYTQPILALTSIHSVPLPVALGEATIHTATWAFSGCYGALSPNASPHRIALGFSTTNIRPAQSAPRSGYPE